MGVDFYGYAGIGYRIQHPNRKDRVRSCQHEDKGTPFCPECGKPTWKNISGLHPMLEEDTVKEAGLHHGHTTDNREVFICGLLTRTGSSRYYSEGDTDYVSLDGVDLAAIKEKVKAYVSQIETWKESQYGLWAFLYCSY